MRLKFTLLFVLSAFLSIAQNNKIEVSGKVIDNNSGQPIEFATVFAGDPIDQQPMEGTTTVLDGSFLFTISATKFYVEIRFIGFETKRIEDFQVQNGKVELGTIALSEDNQVLEEVVVEAERSTTEFKLDKRVFNVGSDLSSTGASALEVLNNVPSVNVNIEGQVSLRGSAGVQILINGKPSVIASEQGNALGTITADMIEKVEVITNPSAKYDAEGTSGIINIVMKKEEKRGLNGSITVNTGIPDNHSVGVSLNRRTEKFNLFSQLGVGYRSLPRDNENINQDLINNTTIFSEGTEYRNETFYNVVLGTDYHINDWNVLTLSGNFAYEVESQPSETDFTLYNAGNNLLSAWKREEETEATNPKWQYELQYKKDFRDDEDHVLLFSALGNFFGKDLNSEFDNTTMLGDVTFDDQQTETAFKEARYTFKFDYTRPFNDKITLEAGAQYVLNDVSNDFTVRNWINDEWVADPSLTNVFDYDQKVLGVYGTGSYEDDRFGVKLGLRVENTDLNTLLETTGEENNQDFTNLFPTVHSSYKMSDNFSVQAGYSRRISRPRLWDLNPFFNIRNNFSIRTGNPDLLPEFTDSYEITSIYIVDKISTNFGVYYRHTTDVVERVATFQNNVSTTMPMNIGTNRAVGVELNAKYTPMKWLTLMGDFNYNYFKREGVFEARSFDFDADQWSSRMTAKLKLPSDFDVELTGRYNSREQNIQGIRSANMFADLGIRKKIMKGKTILNLSIRDIFASRIWENETTQPGFYLYSRSLRGRFITFGISYGFGKGEAMEFSGRRH